MLVRPPRLSAFADRTGRFGGRVRAAVLRDLVHADPVRRRPVPVRHCRRVLHELRLRLRVRKTDPRSLDRHPGHLAVRQGRAEVGRPARRSLTARPASTGLLPFPGPAPVPVANAGAAAPPRSPPHPLGDGRLTGALPRNIREQQGANLGLPIAPVSSQGPDGGQLPGVCPACYGFSINMEHRGDLRWREQLLCLWCACGHVRGLSSHTGRSAPSATVKPRRRTGKSGDRGATGSA